MAKDKEPKEPSQPTAEPGPEPVNEFNPHDHMMQLQGKDYLPVPPRIEWFRSGGSGKPSHSIEEGWGLVTEIIEGGHTAEFATVRAMLLDPQGRTVSTGIKTEKKGPGGRAGGFPKWVEKAETGAIGRCLAFAGLGTLQAQEIEESEDEASDAPCDSPRDSKGSRGGSSGGGGSNCSKCGEALKSGRIAFCRAKSLPLTCTDCG